jgi:hypothetical protein
VSCSATALVSCHDAKTYDCLFCNIRAPPIKITKTLLSKTPFPPRPNTSMYWNWTEERQNECPYNYGVGEGAMRVAVVTPVTSSTGISLFKAAFRCGHECFVSELVMRICVNFHNKVRESSMKLFVSRRKEAMEESIPGTNMVQETDNSTAAENAVMGPLSNPTAGTLPPQGALSNCSTEPTVTTEEGTWTGVGDTYPLPEDQTNHVQEAQPWHADSTGVQQRDVAQRHVDVVDSGGPTLTTKQVPLACTEDTHALPEDQTNHEQVGEQRHADYFSAEQRDAEQRDAERSEEDTIMHPVAVDEQRPLPPTLETTGGGVQVLHLTNAPQSLEETNNRMQTTTATCNQGTGIIETRHPPPAFHDIYLDAKLKYDLAKAQMKLEKKRRRDESEHKLR